jgi:hypothetical protein
MICREPYAGGAQEPASAGQRPLAEGAAAVKEALACPGPRRSSLPSLRRAAATAASGDRSRCLRPASMRSLTESAGFVRAGTLCSPDGALYPPLSANRAISGHYDDRIIATADIGGAYHWVAIRRRPGPTARPVQRNARAGPLRPGRPGGPRRAPGRPRALRSGYPRVEPQAPGRSGAASRYALVVAISPKYSYSPGYL